MSDLDLVKRFEPVLLFSKDGDDRSEFFYPMDTRNFVKDCALFKLTFEDPVKKLLDEGEVTLEKLAELSADTDFLSYATQDLIAKGGNLLGEHPFTVSRLYGEMAVSIPMPANKANSLKESVLPSAHILEHSAMAQHLFHLHEREPITSHDSLQQTFANYTRTEHPTHDERLVHLVIPGTSSHTGGLAGAARRFFHGLKEKVSDLIHTVAHDVDVAYLAIHDNPELAEGEFARMPQWFLKQAKKRYAPYRNLAPVYHYRVRRDDTYTYLQYWFFYAYNDWGTGHGGMNDHEGDWEGLMVVLEGDTAVRVEYSNHVFKETRTWDSEDLQRYDHHPVSFVGCGSHANYILEGAHGWPYIDHALGNDVAIGPDAYVNDPNAVGPSQRMAWGEPVNLDTTPGAAQFAGLWGILWPGLGTYGPTGPSGDKPWTKPLE